MSKSFILPGNNVRACERLDPLLALSKLPPPGGALELLLDKVSLKLNKIKHYFSDKTYLNSLPLRRYVCPQSHALPDLCRGRGPNQPEKGNKYFSIAWHISFFL